MKRLAGAALLIAVVLGCSQVRPPAAPATLQGAGAIVVYLLPFTQDAARLTFRIEGVAAVREDGSLLPLSPLIAQVRGDRATRERRFAEGNLPPGHYRGLALTVTAATLRREEGKADLAVPPAAVPIEVPFQVEKRRGVVLSLKFDFRGSIESGFRFTPSFVAAIPVRPAPDLLGIISTRDRNSVALFDKVVGRVVGLIPTGRSPAGLALDQERRRAYVAVSADDSVELIDMLEQRVLGRARLRGGDGPIDLALTPDGRTLLAANYDSGTVSVIEPESMLEIGRIRVGEIPTQVLIDPLGRRAYVFNSGASTISVIDVATLRVATTIATDAGPFRGEFNRNGSRLYVIHKTSPNVSVIDPLGPTVESRVYVGQGLTAIKIDRDTGRIYLANGRTRSLEIYDPLSLLSIDSIPIDGKVSFMAIDDEGNNLHLVMPESDEIRILGLAAQTTIARIEVGAGVYDVALSGER